VEVFESHPWRNIRQRLDEGTPSGHDMVSELGLFQLSSFCALIGMTLGWRGVMTKFSGFYDLPTAWSQVFWGIVLGGIYAVMGDGLLFEPYYKTVTINENIMYGGLNIFSLMFVALFASVASHLLLRRKRVRQGGSQPSSGWALGLAIGGMTAMVLMFRMFEFEGVFSFVGLMNVGLVALIAPRADALITSRHGYLMLQDRRWGAVLRSTFWRASLLVGLYYVVFNPIGWFFILPFVFLANPSAEKWIWESVPKEGRRRLRRIWAEQARSLTADVAVTGKGEKADS
tara:strand:- start:8 stop:865 length:858 start_codon:yes stop_codon:yes gene_type:complete